VTELGYSDGCDTLGKWMSHHLAELMDRAESEKNAEKQNEYNSQVSELILNIWRYRQSLPGDAYPLAKFKAIIERLTLVSPRDPWERLKVDQYGSLAADTFNMMLNLYRGLHFIEYASLKTLVSNRVPLGLLSDEEQELYEILVKWAEEEMSYRSENGDSEAMSDSQEAVSCLCNYIDQLCKKLSDLKNEIEQV
jgi:hypothetical protein